MARKSESESRILPELLQEPKKWKELLTTSELAKATLTNSLKRLRKKGIVEPVLVEDEVHWQLTPEGRLAALERIGGETEAQDLKKARFSVTIKELYRDAWWDLIKEVADKYPPKDLSRDEYEKNMKSYCNQIKPVVTQLWPSLVHSVVQTIALLLAYAIVVRASLPSPLDKKSRTILSRFVLNVSRPAFGELEKEIAQTLIDNINYLEALVVLSKAIEEGKVSKEERTHKSAEEVIRMLQDRKLLEVIEEPSDAESEKTL